jgi:hypothetical protein
MVPVLLRYEHGGAVPLTRRLEELAGEGVAAAAQNT